MTKPLAVQLYSLRGPQGDEPGWQPALDRQVLEELAATGYLGVETIDVPGGDPVAARRLFDELGLQLTSSHSWSNPQDAEGRRRAFSAIAEMGSPGIAVYGGDLATAAEIDAAVDRLNAEARLAQSLGMTLYLHNETPEARVVDGARVYETLRARIDPSIRFQVDIFWATCGGVAPGQMIRDLGDRVVSLHVKDAAVIAPGVGEGLGVPFFNVAVGDGIVDVAGAIAAADMLPGLEWLIVEFDYAETDILGAVRQSYRNLTSRRLGRGSR